MSKRGNTDSYTNYTAPAASSGSADDCLEVEFVADLKKPQQPALSKAEAGDVFKVKLDSANTPWVYNFDNEPCGVIVSLQSTKLVECLKKGKKFTAAILKVKGDACSVAVRPVERK